MGSGDDKMELLQLNYFFEAAKNESFAKTARKFMVPPSSVSASVKRLENELGVELFDRTCNNIKLNSNGKILQQSLSIVFDELSGAVDSIGKKNQDTRYIRLLVKAMRNRIADNIIEYKTIYPEVNFKTVYNFEETDYEKYDIIIDEKTDKYTLYSEHQLAVLKIRMLASTNSSLCNRRLTLANLSEYPFVSMGEHSNMHKILLNACAKAGFTPKITVQSNDSRCYIKSIAAGIGIGVGSDNLHLDDNTVTPLNVIDFNEDQIVCAYFKKQAAYGNVKNFLDFLKLKTNY